MQWSCLHFTGFAGVVVTLLEAGLRPLLELRCGALDAAARFRPVNGGLGLQLRVASLEARDLASPWPHAYARLFGASTRPRRWWWSPILCTMR